MEFYDCGTIYHCPDIFGPLSQADITRLGVHSAQRRIPFIPVVTNPKLPISIAFVGLNAYCGDDYLEAFRQPNFAEWCQERYEQKIFTVLEYYAAAMQAHSCQRGAFYFTNYFKIVLPQHLFQGEQAAVTALKSAPSAARAFDSALQREIHDLVIGGCRTVVSFGNWSAKYVEQVIRRHFGGLTPTDTDGISRFNVNSCGPVYFAHERHYSFYSKAKTQRLADSVARYMIERKRSPEVGS